MQRHDTGQTGQNNLSPQERMAHIEKMALLGRHAADIAHELRNPLQIILSQVGWTDELLGDEKSGQIKNLDEYLRAMASIKAQALRASHIVSHLLDYARTTNTNQGLGQIALNALVAETACFLEEKGRSAAIALELQLDPELPVITSNGQRLQQVLFNLMDNALDAVGRDGRVRVRTSHDQGSVSVEISDNGPGIPAQLLERIWAPFFTTKEPGRGTGLGLAISRDIILSLDGVLTAQNREDGTGARFTFSLPIHPAAQTSTSQG